MSLRIRKVRTVSGATVVQVAVKERRVRRVVEHLGSAHDEAGPAALVEAGRERSRAGQGVLDLAYLVPRVGRAVAPAVVESKIPALLWNVLTDAYEVLGLGGDEAFRQVVLARLVEPAGKE